MEGVINPRSEEWEQLLTEALAPRIAPGMIFKFNRPKNLDPVQISSVVSKMKDGLSVNDIRAQFNRAGAPRQVKVHYGHDNIPRPPRP